MPLVLHLRWNSLSPQQRAAVDGLVADTARSPGCSSCTSTADGSSVRAVAVFAGRSSLRAFSRGPLADVSAAAGLEPPQTALFGVLDLFAAHPTVNVPAPRAATQERLPAPVGP